MKICGLMKLTLLDFPSKVACTVFLGGCNLRCPFCHNAELAFAEQGDELSEEEFFGFLKKRQGILEGVCVSGGEALMSNDLLPFMKKIKELGYSVKLDTNGCFPERLEEVINSGYCDYIAMDVKNSLAEYPKTVGIADFDTECIKKSIDIIRKSNIPYEFRTTVVKGLHTGESLKELSELIRGEKRYFLQSFVKSDRVPDGALEEFEKDELDGFLDIVRINIPEAKLRGV